MHDDDVHLNYAKMRAGLRRVILHYSHLIAISSRNHSTSRTQPFPSGHLIHQTRLADEAQTAKCHIKDEERINGNTDAILDHARAS
jgi:hypothetical protein